jgi:hypothetical protein
MTRPSAHWASLEGAPVHPAAGASCFHADELTSLWDGSPFPSPLSLNERKPEQVTPVGLTGVGTTMTTTFILPRRPAPMSALGH